MCGRRFRTFNVVDDFNREVLAIEIDLGLPAARVIRVLERVIAWRDYPAKLRMDNGPEFILYALTEWAEQHPVTLEFIKPVTPTQNSFIERFNRTYREAVLNMYAFKTLNEVRELTKAGSENTTKSGHMIPLEIWLRGISGQNLAAGSI